MPAQIREWQLRAENCPFHMCASGTSETLSKSSIMVRVKPDSGPFIAAIKASGSGSERTLRVYHKAEMPPIDITGALEFIE